MLIEWIFTDYRILNQGQRLYITGNTQSLGNWKSFIPMDIINKTWIVNLSLQPNQQIQYKYVISSQQFNQKFICWDDGPNNLLIPNKSKIQANQKIGSFNIRYQNKEDSGTMAWQNRRQALLNRLILSQCHIIVLQEVMPSQLQYIQKKLPYFLSIVWHSREKHLGQGLATIYNNQKYIKLQQNFQPIGQLGVKSFGAGCPRIIQYIVLQSIQNQQITIILNCHLDHDSQLSRTKGSDLALKLSIKLSKKFQTNNLIVLGDFNCSYDTNQLKILNVQPFKCLSKFNQDYTFYDQKIDHAFTISKKQYNFKVDKQKLCSDHRMIIIQNCQ